MGFGFFFFYTRPYYVAQVSLQFSMYKYVVLKLIEISIYLYLPSAAGIKGIYDHSKPK